MAELVLAPNAQPPAYCLVDTLTPFVPAAPAPVDANDPDDVGPDEAPMPATRWPGVGIEFMPEACGLSDISYQGDSCLGTWPDAFTPQGTTGTLETITPFFIWAADEASAFCYRNRDWQARARRQLLMTQSYQIAHELWTGAAADAQSDVPPHRALIQAASKVTDTASSPLEAFTRLDNALVTEGKGAQGMIHVTPQVLGLLQSAFCIRYAGNTWLSAMGNVVVCDAGYTGDGPTTPGDPDTTRPAGESIWMYGTSYMRLALSELIFWPDKRAEVFRQMDRKINLARAWVGVSAMVVWNPCVLLASEVDISTWSITDVDS